MVNTCPRGDRLEGLLLRKFAIYGCGASGACATVGRIGVGQGTLGVATIGA